VKGLKEVFAIFLSGGVESLVLILHFTAKNKKISQDHFSTEVETNNCKQQW